MALTQEQIQNFLRKKKQVGTIIRRVVKKEKAIIFGGRANNKQLKKHLQVQTEDYDIFVKGNPKKIAKKIEKKLDKKFGGNFYRIEKARHEGTYKIQNRVSGKGTADISKQKEKIGFIKRKGVRYANLEFQKKKIRESLSDPKSKFRHDKDKFTRLRIKLNKVKTRKKPKKITLRKKVRRLSKPLAIPSLNFNNLF